RSHRDSVLRDTDVLPASLSVPTMLWRYVLLGAAGYAGAVLGIALLGRFGVLGLRGWQALFAYPDPALGNTLTLYATLAVLYVLMTRHPKVRDVLTGVVMNALGLTVLLGLVFLAVGGVVVILPGGERIGIQPYFLLHILEFA